MNKVKLNIIYNEQEKKHLVIINGKQTSNSDLIGLEILDKLKKLPAPKKNIHRFED